VLTAEAENLGPLVEFTRPAAIAVQTVRSRRS
jgi:hypothetical protein